MDNNDPGFTEAIIHVSGDFSPGVIAIAGNYRTAEDLDNDPMLEQLRRQKDGIVVTLEQNNLQYHILSNVATQHGAIFNRMR